MTEKLPTINLKGKEYVQVKDRIAYFVENYPNGAIKTKMLDSGNGVVTFKAIVYPDIEKKERFFTGHSFGTIKEVKAFEKLETVAVGRCLAFMGIGVIESVASADEMQRFEVKRIEQALTGDCCPVCGGGRTERTGKSGNKFMGCDTFSECYKKNKSALSFNN